MVSKYPMNAAPRPRPDSPRPRPHQPFRPAPAGWPSRPIPKVQPLPKSSGFFLGKAAAKGAARLIPYVGTALVAYELFDYFYSVAGTGLVDSTKFNLTLDCGRPPSGYSHVVQNCQQWGGWFFGDPTSPLTYQFPDNANTIWVTGPTSDYYGIGVQAYLSQRWDRKPGAVGTYKPQPQKGFLPQPVPDFYPWPEVLPQRLPIKREMPQPRTAPRPVGKPKPGEQPSEKTNPKSKPRSGRRNRPEYHRVPIMPFPIVLFPDLPGVPTPIQPDQIIDISPGTSGPKPGRETPPSKWRQSPNSSGNKPPAKGRTKERKADTRVHVRGALGLINLATEANDFLNVLYDALPDDNVCKKGAERDTRRSGKKFVTPYHKAKAVYNCFDAIDVGNAIEGYVNNQVEDYVFGMIGQKVGKATGNFGMTTGLNRALQKQQEMAQGEGPGIGDLIPQIDIDDETGELTVTVPQLGSVGFGTFGSGKVVTNRPLKGK